MDLHANDLVLWRLVKKGKTFRFNVLVGGGLSFEHGNTKTFPELAHEFGFVKLDGVLKVAEAVVTAQRELG